MAAIGRRVAVCGRTIDGPAWVMLRGVNRPTDCHLWWLSILRHVYGLWPCRYKTYVVHRPPRCGLWSDD